MYEKYWEPDEEHDAAELAEVVCDNFIDNLKKGGQMPLVLPAKDEKQFYRLLTKKAQQNEMEFELPSTSVNDDKITKKIKVEPDTESSNFDSTNLKNFKGKVFRKVENGFFDSTNNVDTAKICSPTLQKIKNAGETIKNLINKNDASLMLFQMPASLGALTKYNQRSGSQQQQGTSANISAKATTKSKQPKRTANETAPNFQNNLKHCLSGLPTGVEIGKLQILRSGRAIINIGGNCMDLLEAIPTQCFETAVCIETEKSKDLNSSNNSRSIFGGGPLIEKDNSKNSIQILGDVPYSFVCAYDLRSTKNRRLQKLNYDL